MKYLFTSSKAGQTKTQIHFFYDEEGGGNGALRFENIADQTVKIEPISIKAAKVINYLCQKLQQNGKCNDTEEDIAVQLDINSRTVKRAIKGEEKQGSRGVLDYFSEFGCEEWLLHSNGAKMELGEGVRIQLIETIQTKYYLKDLYHRDLIIDGETAFSIKKPATYLAEEQFGVLLFCGNGGLGKTAFLKALFFAAKSLHKQSAPNYRYPECVCFCSLSVVLEEALSEPIPTETHCKDLAEASLYTSYLLRHLDKSSQLIYTSDLSEKRVLIILDGLNELLNQNSSRSFPLIQQIMRELQMLDLPNIRLIISSRDKADFQLLPAFHSHSVAEATLSTIQPEENEIQDFAEQPEQICTMLCTPLYYNYYRQYIKILPQEQRKLAFGDTEYSLWNLFHLEGCHQAISQNTLPPDDSLYQYYIILPMIAHFMECRRETVISRKNVMRLIGRILDSTMLQERCKLIINQIEEKYASAQGGVNLARAEIMFHKLPQTYYDELRNAGSFIFWEENQIVFRHQTAREYFCAFYVVNFLLHVPMTSFSIEQIPSFNLRKGVQQMVLNGLHSNIEEIPADPDGKLILDAVFKTPAEPITACYSIDDLRNELVEGISFSYTLYTFSDHFRLKSHHSLHKLINGFCSSLIEQPRIFKLYDHLLTPREKAALVEALTSEVMYFRYENDYRQCRKICEFCESFLLPDCDLFYHRMISHQKGKALLCNSGCKFTNGELFSEWYTPEEQVIHTPENLFSEALSLLKKCMPYNMSANLLMVLYSAPVSWITEHGLLERDVCQAFKYVRESYLDMSDQRNILLQYGTELVHTIREMCGLLLKGYVRLENGVPCPGTPSADRTITDQNRDTLVWAEEALQQIASEEYPFLNWNRGMLALYQKDYQRAADYFKTVGNNYMTYIVMLQEPELMAIMGANADEIKDELMKALSEMQSRKHTCVECYLTDTKYRLMDAMQIGWTDFPDE